MTHCKIKPAVLRKVLGKIGKRGHQERSVHRVLDDGPPPSDTCAQYTVLSILAVSPVLHVFLTRRVYWRTSPRHTITEHHVHGVTVASRSDHVRSFTTGL